MIEMRNTFLSPIVMRSAAACFAVVSLMTAAKAADAVDAVVAADAGRDAVIHLINGDYVTGRLVDSAAGEKTLAWQSPAFTVPFQFPIPSVVTVQFPIPAKLPQPEGAYCFELAGGDMLFGSLAALQGNEAELEVSGLGRLHIDRAILRRMYRWQGGSELLFHGPTGLKDWRTTGTANGWREDAGNLVSDQAGAILRRDFGVPPQARFEFEISWKNAADFELALGVGDVRSVQRAFRFEVWDNHLVAQRETELEADLASLLQVKPGAGRIHLQAFLDQKKGQLLVFSSSGQQLADLTVATGKAQSFGGVQLTNKSGDVRLERLSIGRWNGEPPRAVNAEKSRLHGTDGSITYGQIKSYDPDKHQYVVEADGTAQRVDEAQVQDVFFSQENAVTARSLRAVSLNGQRISGDLVKVGENKIWLKCPGIREELPAPIETLQALMGLEPRDSSLASAPTLPAGRLELDGTVLHGGFVESGKNDGSCLTWKPTQCSLSSPLKPGVSARVVYRDPPPKAQPVQAAQATRMVRRIGAQAAVAREAKDLVAGSGGPGATTKPKKPILHLRSGDTISCDTVTIEENGVRFSAPTTDATFIRNDQLKVVELVPNAPPVQIAKTKKERLLMLPRMQRDSPPTHLIRSVEGDYLRGRIMSMDDQQIRVEIRLEEKMLHRDRVARIIWLHADEIAGTAKPEASPDQGIGTRVQALAEPRDGRVSRDGNVSRGSKNEQIELKRLELKLAEKIDIEFTNSSLADVTLLIAAHTQLIFVFDPQAVEDPARISNLSLKKEHGGIPLRDALERILEPLKLGFVIEGNVVKITKAADAAKIKASLGLDGDGGGLGIDGNRLTFVAEQLTGTILAGHSELLGVCRIDLRKIDQLLIGPAIEENAAMLAFHQWRLKAAIDPLAAREEGDAGDDGEGRDSALVGKPAPDFELDLLGGQKFRLSEHRDKIVVLDFWASWCGPCLQVMPQVDKVAHEFADRGVELVAVNLEETEDNVQAALDRLKLKMTVALDRNGRTAEKYGATSIPQTVIIDRNGKVVRLFVGGGARFGDQLRGALEAVLSDKAEKSDKGE
jgi:thiol-disulfide isomerase/thioredoxin